MNDKEKMTIDQDELGEHKEFIKAEFPNFQEYSNYVTFKRKKRHDQCLPKISRKVKMPTQTSQEEKDKRETHRTSEKSKDRKQFSSLSLSDENDNRQKSHHRHTSRFSYDSLKQFSDD